MNHERDAETIAALIVAGAVFTGAIARVGGFDGLGWWLLLAVPVMFGACLYTAALAAAALTGPISP